MNYNGLENQQLGGSAYTEYSLGGIPRGAPILSDTGAAQGPNDTVSHVVAECLKGIQELYSLLAKMADGVGGAIPEDPRKSGESSGPSLKSQTRELRSMIGRTHLQAQRLAEHL